MNTVRTEEKSLYSEKLKKQLAFLEDAQETLGQFSTSDLLCELLNRNATHKHYDSLREITTVTVDYDGKLYDN